MKKRVVLESPFSGNVERNVEYAKLCLKDMLSRSEAPIASHLLMTQPGILDDTKPEERSLGMEAGFSWLPVAHLVAVYDDFGVSKGMEIGIQKAMEAEVGVHYRKLPKHQVDKLKSKFPDKDQISYEGLK
jgi:hypothetical protein